MIASASARSAAAIVSPSESIPSRSSTTSIRVTVASMAADPGRTFFRAFAAPRIVARRANGRCVRSFPAVNASVTAPSWACAGDPTIASSRIAATPSPPPRTSMSARMSGSRRWSTTRHTSPSQRIGARNPAPAARSSVGAAPAGIRGPGSGPTGLDRLGIAEQLPGRLGGLLLEQLRRADDRSHRAEHVARELAEEPSPVGVRRRDRLGRPRGSHRLGRVGRRAGLGPRGLVSHRRAARPTEGADRSRGEAWESRQLRRQYWMTLVTRRPSSRSRPLRNSSSTRKASPTTSPFRRSTSSIVPRTVPPVARRSSTISTF